MNLNRNFSEFIKLLNEHEVEYMLAGGYAVILYGYPRYTGDMDIFIKKSKKNAQKVVAVLNDFGFKSLEITPDDFTKPDMILQLGARRYG